MATNENQIGVVAQFDISQFTKDQQKYNAALNDANSKTQAFYNAQTAQIKKASEESKATLTANLAEIGLAIKGVEEITGGLIEIFQKAFEFGKAGATINQINASFQQLIGTEKQASDMEQRLSAAVRGTMTGEQIRTAVIKMLTGAEGEFADKVKESAPALFEMAAAANKLNPTLGGTNAILELMDQALESGTTRSLKRLGIIVDQTKAEKDYADSIGVSVDTLDEEQKKVAVLNGVLQDHDTFLRQVGGDVDSMVDPYTRLSVAFEEIGDKIKTTFTPAITALVEDLAIILTSNDKINAALEKQQTHVLDTSKTWEEYVRQYLLAKAATTGVDVTDQSVLEVMKRLNDTTDQSIKLTGMLTEAEWESTKADQANSAAMAQMTDTRRESIKESRLSAQDTKDITEAQKARTKAIQDYGDKSAELQIKAGEDILSAEKDFHDKSAKAWQDYITKTHDIISEGIKDRAKIQQTYNDKIASAERDYNRGVEDLNYSHGQKMADIERNYQDTIRNIQQTYQEDALDAVRNLDAIGLIRAREKRDKDMAAAKQDHDRSVADENENYARSLYELARALADKRDEAERDKQRSLEEQRQAEQDKQDQAKQAYDDQLTDAQQAFDDKLAAINQSYTNEDNAAAAHYLNQQNALRAHLAAMQAIMAQYGIGTSGESVNPIRQPGGGYVRAEGGVDIVNTPTQFTAGEAGPEIAMFVPLNRALPSPLSLIHI